VGEQDQKLQSDEGREDFLQLILEHSADALMYQEKRSKPADKALKMERG